MLAPGVYTDISHKQYHDLPIEIVSNSYLGRMDKTPAHTRVKQEDTPALIFGRATHVYILEGAEAFFKEFAVPPSCDKRTKEGKEIWGQFQVANLGKGLVTEDDFVKIIEMDYAVKRHPFAKELLAEGVSEQTVIWKDEETGILCKCRPDRTPDGNKGILVDLKTTRDAAEYAFGKSVLNYGYARQAAFYTEGISKATGQKFDAFCFIAVESQPPYRCEVYVLAAEYLSWGWTQVHRLLRLETECRVNNLWPNFVNAGAQDLLKPAYL